MNAGAATYAIYTLLIIQAALYSFLFYPNYDDPHVLRFIVIATISSALWIAIILIANKFQDARRNKRLLLWGLVAGLVFRLIVLWGAGEHTYFSDDVYRYIWDGKLTSEGLNPFALAPTDPALADLVDTSIHPHINHPTLPTIYPPVSQFWFTVSYWLDDDGIVGYKIIAFIFDLLALLALWRLTRVSRLPTTYILIYWLAPLVLLEYNLSAHHDVLYLAPLTMALVAVLNRKVYPAAIFITIAVLTKFLAALVVPALLLSFAGRERMKFALTIVLLSALAYLPYITILQPPELIGSLKTYLTHWQYNGSLYTALSKLFSDAVARPVMAAALLVSCAYFTLAIKDKITAAYLCLISYAALTTTLFPWYLGIFFPFMIIRRSGAIFSLMALVFLSYWGLIGKLETGLWYDNWWLRTLEYVPFYLLLIMAFRRPELVGPREEGSDLLQ